MQTEVTPLSRFATGSVPDLERHPDRFVDRHIGPAAAEVAEMVRAVGYDSLDRLIDATVPPGIRLQRELNLPEGRSEFGVLQQLRELAGRNQLFRNFIGLGYSDCITPPVIQRNLFENPGWYTPYTPYQAEVAQGRLESLLNFQTMIADLTALPVANASLLDEASAAAEAMAMCHGINAAAGRTVYWVSRSCHPQTIDVLTTRGDALGISVRVADHAEFVFDAQVIGALVQYPATDGEIVDFSALVEAAHQNGALVTVAADLLSLTLLRPPGEWGADVAVGSAQRFGVPLGYGGPHAAFFATREKFRRQMPGRLIGVSKDARGRPALRLSLQTREQHIRRERATSNICTAQALLANMAAMYAVYHGPEGLRRIARRVHRFTTVLVAGLRRLGWTVSTRYFFDTIRVDAGAGQARVLIESAERQRVNLRQIGDRFVGIALDETVSEPDLTLLFRIFSRAPGPEISLSEAVGEAQTGFPEALERTTPFLTHPIFNRHHSETEMLRYLRRLESRDLSLANSMVPLGSCTMKLNATVEMLPVSWPEFSRLHPFAPRSQAAGYQMLFRQLQGWLGEITGFPAVSLQPNAGSQGEFAGLLTVRKYHRSRGQGARNICLIPTSAHGTNPASAVMVGMKVVPVLCDADGNIDLADLRAKAEANRQQLAALMVTYPSTHGVFETEIREICQIVHDHGGQVYMDGANLNAQVGLCRPADFGVDVCHLNLHKTFCIPHGGGGPGVGPVAAAEHLAPFLPGHAVVPPDESSPQGAVAAAPWGSASILPISWVYIAAMGAAGLVRATKIAILNANYIARRLDPYFPVLYRGPFNLVAHECILDLRKFNSVTVEDVAKRLMDYGFHAPTVSFPVAGTLMIEPTESETKAELDRFCEAMIAIHGEITEVETGAADPQNNLLKNAPHTAEMLADENWSRPYNRERAVYPAPWLREHKFWPPVGRIDNVYGDRNLVCSCAGMESYL